MTKLIEPCDYYKYRGLEDLPDEIWVDIQGFEGYYQISDMGRVKSLDRFVPNDRHGKVKITQRIMKLSFYTNGYLKAHLRKDGASVEKMIHRLVGLHFIENPENKPQINHKKGIKTDNRKTELEWATMGENNLHAYRTGLKKHHACWKGKSGYSHNKSFEVVEFDKIGNELNRYGSTNEASRALNISQAAICNWCNGGNNRINENTYRYSKDL